MKAATRPARVGRGGENDNGSTPIVTPIVTAVRVWAVIAATALGLGGCGDRTAEVKVPLEPGGGFRAERQDSVRAALSLPEKVSPDAALIQGEASLENTANDVEVVSVPRACDVLDWVLRDAAGQVVMTKDPVECIEQPASKALAPGSVLRERIWVYLLPNVLRSGNRYTVDYRFWGQPAEATFTAGR
jgi:hypothetical protein